MATAAEHLRAGLQETVDDFLRLFASVYFAVSLFAIWGFFTLIGVIVEQGKTQDFYWANYAPALARLILRLDLDNIYHSAAYVGIIGLILTSLAVCTFKRVIPARLPPLRAITIDRIPLHATIPVEGDEREIRDRIERFFRATGWFVRKREFGGEEWTFADKHNWARRGVLVAHMGFVIIAAGTTWYWAQGFSGQTPILTGTTATIPQTGAQITLDSFNYRFDPIHTKAGLVYQPIDYVSHVRYVGKDGLERPATIRVNHPLDIDGTLYYQAAYGFGAQFVLTKNGRVMADSPRQLLMEGDEFSVGGDRALEYDRFVGTVDRKTGRPSIDPRPNNPAVVVRMLAGDTAMASAMIPIGSSIDLGGGYRLSVPSYRIYSGIQYRYDPGMGLVGLGAFVLLTGLCMAFYFLPARLYVKLNGSGRQWSLGIAATTVKGYEVFEDQFRELVAALSRATKREETSACS
ncbi:MAG: cytochrome c biogenesis protein ResB [Vulcanimicrobiaceae bacterium]